MTVSGWLTIFLFVGILTALAIPMGNYMAAVYTGERTFMDRILGGPERLLYRVMRVDTTRGMDWKAYAKSLILFSLAGWLLLYFFLRTQTLWNWTGLNPLGTYYDLSAGILANYGENYEVRLSGSNLTNQLGLTEGNARVGGNAVVNGVGFGRSILGREVNFTVKYKW